MVIPFLVFVVVLLLPFLRKLYEFRCPNDANKKHFTEDYINLPTNVTCDECFDDFNLREHLFIVYEVTNNV